MSTNTIFEGAVNIIDNIDLVDNGYGDLTVSRLVRTPSVYLPSGVQSIELKADPVMTGSYSYSYPASGPTGDGQIVATSGSGTVFYDINTAFEIWVRKNPGVGEYSSLASALAAIPLVGPTVPSASTPWVVRVDAGVYSEPAIVFPASYIYVVGVSMEGVSFEPSGLGYTFFTFANNTGLSFAGIYNTDPLFPACYFYNTGEFCLLHKVTFSGCEQVVDYMTDALATAGGQLYLEYVDMTSAIQYSLRVRDTNLLGGFGSYCSIENYFTFNHSNDAIIVSGLNSALLAHACELSGDGSGNGLVVSNGAVVNIRSMAIIGYANGFYVPNDATTPNIKMSGVIFTDCTFNINILNPLCAGFYSGGFSEYIKTIIPKVAPFFINGQDQQIITVAKKGGNFSSVVAALAAITDNSSLIRYNISIGPGIFVETQIVMKPYVTLTGFSPSTTILAAHPSIAGLPFVTGARYSSVTRLALGCADYAFPPSYLVEFLGDPLGQHFRCDFVVLDSSLDLIHIGSTLGPCIFIMGVASVINMSAPFRRGFYIEDSGPSNYPITFSIDNILWGADATGVTNFTEMFVIKSFKSPSAVQNIFGAVTNSTFGTNWYGPAGKGFCLIGGVYVVVETCLFGGLNLAVEVQSSSEPTFMILTNSTISNNTADILVSSAVAFGTISVNATLSKVTIDPASNFGIQIADAAGGIAFGGDMYQGVVWNQLTNISEQIQHASTTGIINGQTSLVGAGGLNISIGSGTGYVFIGPITSNHLKYISWAANPTFALPDNALSWLYVDETGTIGFTASDPDPIANVILGAVKTYGGSITYIQEAGHVLNNLSSNIDDILRDTWGPVVRNGCLASPGSAVGERAVQVSSGFYSLGVSQYPPVGGDNVSMIGYYGGSVETAPFTNIPLMWDNAGVLTAIGAGMWVKHSVYILSSLTGVTQYFFVYGQQEFATELDAQVGGIPTPPPTFTANMCPVAGVIVTDTDPSSPLAASRFRDIRPTLGFRSEGATASADHNSLLNLTVGNAHPQYFRVDGTSLMTGDINLGTQNIFGSGGNLLNGVDLLAHASRHLPGGADALATAAPVGVGAANAIGVAASFARSDHVHAGVSSLSGTANQVAVSGALGAVTISTPATFIAPGTIKDTTGLYTSTTTGIAASGATQGTATALLTTYNIVSTTPSGTGVILPLPTMSGLIITVVNRGANALLVYPNVGAIIDSAAVNVPITIGVNSAASFQAATTLQWYTENPSITAGAGISVTYASGFTQVSNTGVLSVKADAGSSEVGALTLISGTNVSIVDSPAGTFTFNVPTGAGGVATWSGGTTGLTPVGATSGVVTLGGTLVAGSGGTGLTSYTIGDLIYASGATALSKLLAVNSGNALISNGVGAAPLWGKIDLTTTVSGVLPVTNGGTNISSYTTGDLLYASGAGTLSKLADVATGSALISGGVGVAPLWGKIGLGTHVSGVLPIANGGTNSSTALNNNRIMVSSTGSIVEAAALVNGQLLIGSTGLAPVAATITAGAGITILNGPGSITVSATGVNPIVLCATTSQISVGTGVVAIVGYIPWSNADYGGFTTRTVTTWIIPSATVGKDVTISVLPNGGPSIGSITVPGGAAVGALYTFTITNPGVDTNLQFQVSRTGGVGNNAIVNGITLKLT